ncbi:MAG: hypothetical protein JW923_00480 [Spirochaetales bacterium]|nr:hypothetical protein [Spirochaetales bacterium]
MALQSENDSGGSSPVNQAPRRGKRRMPAWLAKPLDAVRSFVGGVLGTVTTFFRKTAGAVASFTRPAFSAVGKAVRTFWSGARKANEFLSPSWLMPPRTLILVLAMALVSALVMAVEGVQFNMLFFVANYVKATSVISIAMIGIAIGGFLAFALGKARPFLTMAVASALLFVSLALSYLGIVNFGAMGFPIYMVLPYVAASLIVSVIFTQAKSTLAYFANLVASGLGAICPIFLVPVLKSEGTLFAFMLVPIAILFLFSLRIRNVIGKVAAAVLIFVAGLQFYGFLTNNVSYPERIAKDVFETKIVSEMQPVAGERASVNFTSDFLKRVYTLDTEAGLYQFSSDEYDLDRARHFLGVLGFTGRFGMEWLGFFDYSDYVADVRSIPKDVFEFEILPASSRRYSYAFPRSYDLGFITAAYSLEGDEYVLSDDRWDRERARLLLGDLGHFTYLDLALDMRRNGYYSDAQKSFNNNERIVVDLDSTLGRVQYTRNGVNYNMGINGTLLDNMDSYNGSYLDPRVPHMENPKIFIVGLSADGIVKSARRKPGAKVYGVELNPIIWDSMTDGGVYQVHSNDPYKDVEAARAEARSYLETSDERYDMITLMNIHQDHGVVATLGPEHFHSVEATLMMFDKLTDRGYLNYEEILIGRRSELAFLKMLNTLKAAIREAGQENPELCIYISKWDFWGGDAFRTVLARKTPFTKEEVRDFNDYYAQVKATGYYTGVGIVYDPYSPAKTSVDAFIRGEDVTAMRELPTRIRSTELAKKVLATVSDSRDADFVLSKYVYSGGYYYLNASKLSVAERYRMEGIMDRAGYSLDLDLSPVRDDTPFPFNVYAKKTEVIDIFMGILPLVLLLAVPLLVILLRSVKSYSISLWPPVAFAAISGFAFMLIEIVLMQKFQLFVGDPTRSLIVVLGGMLLFSGLGSFASGFLPRRILPFVVLLIPVLLALYGAKLDVWFSSLAHLRGASRLWAAGGIIAPLAFLMGMPFPNALEAIKEKTSPDFASLLFGVNGLASTLGSVGAIFINVSWGYSKSFEVGTIAYIAALVFFVYFIARSLRKAKA